MKRKLMIVMLGFLVSLSGCVLFPLREDATPVVVNDGDNEEDKGSGNLIKPAAIEEGEEESGINANTVYCVSPVNVRDAASSNSNIIGSLRTGDAVNKLGESGGWIEIQYEGRSGFVYERFIGNTPP